MSILGIEYETLNLSYMVLFKAELPLLAFFIAVNTRRQPWFFLIWWTVDFKQPSILATTLQTKLGVSTRRPKSERGVSKSCLRAAWDKGTLWCYCHATAFREHLKGRVSWEPDKLRIQGNMLLTIGKQCRVHSTGPSDCRTPKHRMWTNEGTVWF